jgi:hypothetical protein
MDVLGPGRMLYSAMSLHSRIYNLISQLESQSVVNGPGVSDILLGTGGMHATEPKDRIFALYGVLQALDVSIPEPNYDKPLAKVYIEAATTIINYDVPYKK